MTDEAPLSENERRACMFENMARQIRLNADAKFGGAFLLIPPDSTEEQCYSSLMLNQEEPGVFWGALKALIEMAMGALERVQRQQGFR